MNWKNKPKWETKFFRWHSSNKKSFSYHFKTQRGVRTHFSCAITLRFTSETFWNNQFHYQFLSTVKGISYHWFTKNYIYLIFALSSEPLTLIHHPKVTYAHFQITWDILKDKYDDKSIVIELHNKRLFGHAQITKSSSSEYMFSLSRCKEKIIIHLVFRK